MMNTLVQTPEVIDELGYNVYNYQYVDQDKIFYRTVNPEVTQQVLQYCNKNRTISPEINLEITQSKLAGDIQYEYTLSYDETIYELIKTTVRHSLSALMQAEVVDIVLESPWVNYQKQYEANPTHRHGGKYSLVWYLDIPEVIREEHLQQKSNGYSRGLIEFTSIFVGGQLMRFNPRTSDMFVFDARHNHQVYPFYSDVERVSMSTNVHGLTINHPEEGIVNL